MPAILCAVAGPSAGNECWITEDVSRVGNEAGCEWQLAELEPHALTLYYRNGQYTVFNRGRRTITIGNASVQTGCSAKWDFDDLLQIGATVLRLWTDGDKAPSPKPRAVPRPEEEQDAGKPEPTAQLVKRPTRRWPLVAVCGALLFAFATSHTTRIRTETDDFASLIADWQRIDVPDDLELSLLPQNFQQARSREIRRSDHTARLAYEAILKALDARQSSWQQWKGGRDGQPTTLDGKPASCLDELEAKTYEFVETRIASLPEN
jgi:hypothetical protein